MLTAEQLLEVAATLTCTGAIYRYRMHLSERFQRLIAMLAPVEDLGVVALHAAGLSFLHPATGEAVDLSSPLPNRIARLLSHLSGH